MSVDECLMDFSFGQILPRPDDRDSLSSARDNGPHGRSRPRRVANIFCIHNRCEAFHGQTSRVA